MRLPPRTEPRAFGKLPPILDLDEDGVPIVDMDLHEGRAWSSDEDDPSVQMSDFPASFDD